LNLPEASPIKGSQDDDPRAKETFGDGLMALAWFVLVNGDSYKVSPITILQHGIYSQFIKEFPLWLVWHSWIEIAMAPFLPHFKRFRASNY